MSKRITKNHRIYVKKICECNTTRHAYIFKALVNPDCDYDVFADAFMAKRALYDIIKNEDIDELTFEIGHLDDIYKNYGLDVDTYKDILNKAFIIAHKLIMYYSRCMYDKVGTLSGLASAICLMDHITIPYIDPSYMNNQYFFSELISDTIRAFRGMTLVSDIFKNNDIKKCGYLKMFEFIMYRKSNIFFINLVNYLSEPVHDLKDTFIIDKLVNATHINTIKLLLYDLFSYNVTDDSNYIG